MRPSPFALAIATFAFVLTVGTAVAQQPAGQPAQPAMAQPGADAQSQGLLPQRAIVNGKPVQPRGTGAPGKADQAQVKALVNQTADDPVASAPLVQPHDLYGNPLGSSTTATPLAAPKPGQPPK